ncbi:MAG TPA: PAS domain S-box protein [bacterium]|nr:PAS domain S-box protein [bacterium]
MTHTEQTRIMILEDEAIVAMELEERLTALGYRVAGPVASFDEALGLGQEHPPDLLLADIRIDGCADGIEVACAFRDRFRVPTVFLSAHADATTVRRALNSAPFGYLTKPFREQELHATIEAALHRHRLEQALERREAQLRMAQRLGQMGHWERDLHGSGGYLSPEICGILGIDPDALEGDLYQQFLACVHPDDRERLRTGRVNEAEALAPQEHRYRIVRPDGEMRHIHSRTQVVRDAAGRPTKIFGMSQDVTELERALISVQESEARFATLFDSSPDALVVVDGDGDGRIILANGPAKALFGYSDEEFARLEVEALVPGSLRAKHRQLRAAFAEAPRPRAMGSNRLLEAVTKDGRHLPVAVSLGHTTLDGKLVVIAAIRDVSPQIQAEQKLRESEERHRLLIEQASDGIFLSDAEGWYRDVNPAGCQMLGYSREELLRLNLRDVAVPEDLARTPLRIDDLKAGKVVVIERLLRRKDGTVLPVEISAKALRDGQLQAIVRDITERRQAEEQLRNSEERLRQSQKMEAVGHLAGGMAHDFNNMLQVVRGYAQLLEREVAPKSAAARDIATIMQATEDASALTRQLLAFSRQRVVQKQDVDLLAVLNQQAKMLRRLIGEHIELHVAGPASPLRVHADPGLLQQVFLNLCVNARDAMPDGGELTIEVQHFQTAAALGGSASAATPGPYAAISVRDTGTGMSEQVREHLFEPFFTTKEAGKGTGLGLFTVYGIIKHHGGAIDVDSAPGMGTTFRIHLPLRIGAPAPAPTALLDDGPGGTETVLVAEDDHAVRELVVRLLEEKGYRVIAASDGNEAIDTFTRHADTIDAVLMDMVMPKQTGAAVYRHVRQSHPHLPVLLMTGYAGNAVDLAFIEDHQVPIIRKPYAPDDLLRLLRNVLDAGNSTPMRMA